MKVLFGLFIAAVWTVSIAVSLAVPVAIVWACYHYITKH